MADRKYTRSPLNGVGVPKNGIADLARGIWKKLFVRSLFMIYFHDANLRITSLHVDETVGKILVY